MASRAGARLTADVVDFAEAAPDDWPGIWDVFRAVVARGDTYPFPPDIREEDARAAWLKEGEREATFVARVGDAVVGTAYVKPNQPGLGDHVANAGWMVHPDMQGRGLGRRFADFVLDQARERGFRAMQFNSVVSTNTAAVRLWESLGFGIVGTVPGAFRHPSGLVPVYIMYRQL